MFVCACARWEKSLNKTTRKKIEKCEKPVQVATLINGKLVLLKFCSSDFWSRNELNKRRAQISAPSLGVIKCGNEANNSTDRRHQFPLPAYCEVWHFLRLAQIKASPRCPRIEKSQQIMSRLARRFPSFPTFSHRFPSHAHFIWINLRPQVAHINPLAVALSRRASCKCAALLSLCPLQDLSGRRLWVHLIMRKFRVWIWESLSHSLTLDLCVPQFDLISDLFYTKCAAIIRNSTGACSWRASNAVNSVWR